ncbi:hypothetical protein CBL_05267 [Carabus blaptoides fortunei]
MLDVLRLSAKTKHFLCVVLCRVTCYSGGEVCWGWNRDRSERILQVHAPVHQPITRRKLRLQEMTPSTLSYSTESNSYICRPSREDDNPRPAPGERDRVQLRQDYASVSLGDSS